VILTDHSTYDFNEIVRCSKLVIDTRNATKGLEEFKDKIIKLGAGADGSKTSHTRDEGDRLLLESTRHEPVRDSETLG
jgi:hypothetical protein